MLRIAEFHLFFIDISLFSPALNKSLVRQHFECDDATEIWHILQILVLPLSYLIVWSLLSCSLVSTFHPAFSCLRYEKAFTCGESLGMRLVVMYISFVSRPSLTPVFDHLQYASKLGKALGTRLINVHVYKSSHNMNGTRL